MIANLLYVAWNRRAYTEATFEALLENTNWGLVGCLHVHDDVSKDGTTRYLQDALERVPASVDVRFESLSLRGPVAIMNRHLDLFPETPEVAAFVKIDSDIVLPPGWLDELLRVASADPGIDMLGIQPRFGPPVAGLCEQRRGEAARHIGGVGLMRYRAFDVCRPVPNGRHGFTEFQTRHPDSRKAWLIPDLPAFALDLIDVEPWASLHRMYVRNGWAREWPQYADGGRGYYEWWLQQRHGVAAA